MVFLNPKARSVGEKGTRRTRSADLDTERASSKTSAARYLRFLDTHTVGIGQAILAPAGNSRPLCVCADATSPRTNLSVDSWVRR